MSDQHTLHEMYELPETCPTCGATCYSDGTVSPDCAGECDREICSEDNFTELNFHDQFTETEFSDGVIGEIDDALEDDDYLWYEVSDEEHGC